MFNFIRRTVEKYKQITPGQLDMFAMASLMIIVPVAVITVSLGTAANHLDKNYRTERAALLERVIERADLNGSNQLEPQEIESIYRALNKHKLDDLTNEDLRSYLEID